MCQFKSSQRSRKHNGKRPSRDLLKDKGEELEKTELWDQCSSHTCERRGREKKHPAGEVQDPMQDWKRKLGQADGVAGSRGTSSSPPATYNFGCEVAQGKHGFSTDGQLLEAIPTYGSCRRFKGDLSGWCPLTWQPCAGMPSTFIGWKIQNITQKRTEPPSWGPEGYALGYVLFLMARHWKVLGFYIKISFIMNEHIN